MGVLVYLYSQMPLAGVLIFLTGLVSLIVFILFSPLSVTVSRLGISKRSILRSWVFGWKDITGWNLVNVSSKCMTKYTIWFRTGANVYKISPDFLRKDGSLEKKRVTANVQRPDGNSKKGATLYTQPKLSSKKIGTIPNDTLITIVGFDCFGFKVAYKGKTGWLSADDSCGNPVTTCR